MIEEVPLLFYTTDAIIALGLAGNKGLPVRELATLFKKEEVSGAGPSEKARYVLTENGWWIFRLIPSYSIQYTSLGFRLLMVITAPVHPRQLFPRIALTIALGSIISLFSFTVPALFPFVAARISFLVFIGGVLTFDMLRADLAEWREGLSGRHNILRKSGRLNVLKFIY